MIAVTDTAKDMLHVVRQRVGPGTQDRTIRLTPRLIEGNRLRLIYDHPHEGDQIVEHNGEKVLAIDRRLARVLDGTTLDTRDTPEGRQLTLRGMSVYRRRRYKRPLGDIH